MGTRDGMEKSLPKSDLVRTVLKLNPGEDRRMVTEVRKYDKLINKVNRTGEFRRQMFTARLEKQRQQSVLFYEKQAKQDGN